MWASVLMHVDLDEPNLVDPIPRYLADLCGLYVQLTPGEKDMQWLMELIGTEAEGEFDYTRILKIYYNYVSCPESKIRYLIEELIAFVGKQSSSRRRYLR